MPEFVLLDVHLPKVDGLQVLERLREDERTELVPVILFSSSREDMVEGYRLGTNSHAIPRLVLAQPQRVAIEENSSSLPRR
jgi:CheY-like chemotaxis protein